MPICHNKKLIFIHIPKTGGTSVEKSIGTTSLENLYSERRCLYSAPEILEKFESTEQNKIKFITPQHLTASQLKTVVGDKLFASYQKFTIVRNPFDRLVSEYRYVISDNGNMHQKLFRNLSFNEFVNKSLSLPNFARYAVFDNHLTPQVEFIDPLRASKKFKIFKYEEIENVFEWLNVEPLWLRKSNNRKPWEEYYTTELKELVYNFYKEDFKKFDYPYNP
jgi:hypothetical protein